MANYLDTLAQNLTDYPTKPEDLDSLQAKHLLALSAFNDLQKQRLLAAMQQRYQGSTSPIKQFGQGTAQQFAANPDYEQRTQLKCH